MLTIDNKPKVVRWLMHHFHVSLRIKCKHTQPICTPNCYMHTLTLTHPHTLCTRVPYTICTPSHSHAYTPCVLVFPYTICTPSHSHTHTPCVLVFPRGDEGGPSESSLELGVTLVIIWRQTLLYPLQLQWLQSFSKLSTQSQVNEQ